MIAIYAEDVASRHARPGETAARLERLLDFFGGMTLAGIDGRSCRAYAARRGSAAAARRELEDLRAAIGHHRAEGLCREVVAVTLPPRPPARLRWLTRGEAARLIRAAWRAREVQAGTATGRRPRRHVARWILLALYTGTRAGAVSAAALEPGRTDAHGRPRGWIDLDRGVFYRRGEGARETRKRAPPVLLPDRLLAHIRRWHRLGIAREAVIEWRGAPAGSIRRAFRAAVREAGLEPSGPRAVTPHVLRHTAVTWAMQAGVDRWQAAGYFGLTLETIERVYGHHHPDHLADARRAVTARPGAARAAAGRAPEPLRPLRIEIVDDRGDP